MDCLTHRGFFHRAIRGSMVLATCLGLAACGSGESNLTLLYDATKTALLGADASSVQLEQAAAVPYASMGVRLGNGPQLLIVMVGDAPHNRLWTASRQIALQTDDGRITRTSGLNWNLAGVTAIQGNMISLTDSLNSQQLSRTLLYDFADMQIYSASVQCRLSPPKAENVHILGKVIAANHLVENCNSAALGWRFSNQYWLSESGTVMWKSIQHVHPKLDPITTEILRPPG